MWKSKTRTLKSTALALALLLLPLQTGAEAALEKPELKTKRDQAINYMHGKLSKDNFKYVLDWPAVTLYAAGESVTAPKWSTIDGKNGVVWRELDLERHVNISDATTDFESTLLGALASGQNPRAFGKKDLVQAVLSSQLENGKFADTIYGYGEELLNPHIYGIISLYAAGLPIPNVEKATDYLLSKQHADGGFDWSNDSTRSNTDMTAMALIAMKALGLGAEHEGVNKALHYLKSQQNDRGGFSSQGVENPDTCSIIIEALLMHDIDPTSWKKGSGDPITAMLSYQKADGSFAFTAGGNASMWATNNGAVALSDLVVGESVYERLHTEHLKKANTWKPAFADLSLNSSYYAEIMKLVNLGVMSGYPDGTYHPHDNVTREQFAKIVVYGLNLQDEVGAKTSKFQDVTPDRWSNPFINVATQEQHSLMVGTSGGTFDPTGNLNGAQIMTVLVRALGLQDQATLYPGQAWYQGYINVAEAQGLYYPNFDPQKPATRAEVSYAFVRFYEAQMRMVSDQK